MRQRKRRTYGHKQSGGDIDRPHSAVCDIPGGRDQGEALRKGSTLEYVHQDHLGGTIATTNTSGATVAARDYYPFGETRAASGTLSTDKQFTGQRLSSDTGLYFYNARYYDAGIGRFVSPETIVPGAADPQCLNRYSYVRNNRSEPIGEPHGDAGTP